MQTSEAGLSLLPYSVGKKTALNCYVPNVRRFLEFALDLDLPMMSREEIDNSILVYLDYLVEDEEVGPHRGDYVVHGMAFVWPELSTGLPRANRALRAWHKMHVAGEGGPQPLEVWAALDEAMRLAGSVEAADAAALAVDAYLRSAEVFALRVEDIVDADDDVVAIKLGVQERNERTKTGVRQGVLIDRPHIADMLRARKAAKKPGELVFGCSVEAYRRALRKASDDIGIVAFPAHSARHSGPSHDAAEGYRTVWAIQRRGRWASEKSVLRYMKTHALVAARAAVPAAVMARGRELLARQVAMEGEAEVPVPNWQVLRTRRVALSKMPAAGTPYEGSREFRQQLHHCRVFVACLHKRFRLLKRALQPFVRIHRQRVFRGLAWKTKCAECRVGGGRIPAGLLQAVGLAFAAHCDLPNAALVEAERGAVEWSGARTQDLRGKKSDRGLRDISRGMRTAPHAGRGPRLQLRGGIYPIPKERLPPSQHGAVKGGRYPGQSATKLLVKRRCGDGCNISTPSRPDIKLIIVERYERLGSYMSLKGGVARPVQHPLCCLLMLALRMLPPLFGLRAAGLPLAAAEASPLALRLVAEAWRNASGTEAGVWGGLARAGHASSEGPGQNGSVSAWAGGLPPGPGGGGPPGSSRCVRAADCAAGQVCTRSGSGEVVRGPQQCLVDSACFCTAASRVDRQALLSQNDIYVDGPRVTRGAWSSLCYSAIYTESEAAALCTAEAGCTVLYSQYCNDDYRVCFSSIADIAAKWAGVNSDACTKILYEVATSTGITSTRDALYPDGRRLDGTSTSTTAITSTSTGALYIDGPRVASSAWSGLCYSSSTSRTNAEAACNADPDCIALHDIDCTDLGVRYCYSAISDIVANWEGTDSRACTYVKYQVTTSTLIQPHQSV
ncbi:unnamed protein product [Prorocentrum cordatum]|uniref:Uncharacterized protein n=1 Tax=Prorocentrum cordatum TaxID=2364126 RepID=A0ABN9WXU5_9DINO|nr:unnamed protein product [Polarella glacialis]